MTDSFTADILETNLGAVVALIPTMSRDSKQEFELGVFASVLRTQKRLVGLCEHHSLRWNQLGSLKNSAAHSHSGVRGHVIMRLYRAELFLRAPTDVASQTSSTAFNSQQLGDGELAAIMHEPWSDFGMD